MRADPLPESAKQSSLCLEGRYPATTVVAAFSVQSKLTTVRAPIWSDGYRVPDGTRFSSADAASIIAANLIEQLAVSVQLLRVDEQ